MLHSSAYRLCARRITSHCGKNKYLVALSAHNGHITESRTFRRKSANPLENRRPLSSSRHSTSTRTREITPVQLDRCSAYLRQSYHRFRHLSTGNTTSESDNDRKEAVNNPNGTTVSSPSSPSIWTQIQSVPNMITLGRMASTPVLCYWIVHEHYALAISGCILAAISDGLDGYLAKHYDGSTVLGTYLDPIADKVLINGLAASLWYSGILPTPLTLLWATKDAMLLSGTAWYLYQQNQSINILSNSIMTKPLTVTPSLLGKANTGLQFATLWVGIMTPVMSPASLPPLLLPSLCWVTGFTTVGALVSYARNSSGIVGRRET